VVPEYLDKRDMIIAYESNVIDIDSNYENKFPISHMAFEQKIQKRRVISSKGRIYYEKNKWYTDGPDKPRLFTTLIFPENLIGEVVTIIPKNTK
jgi:hypothetical protein